MFLPFRAKIVLWYTVAALSTLVIFQIVSMRIVRQSLLDELDSSLRAEVEWVRGILMSSEEQGLSENQVFQEIVSRSRLSPRKEFIEIYNLNGVQALRSPNLESDEMRSFGHGAFYKPITIKNFRNHSIRIFGMKYSSYEIYIGYPTTDTEIAGDEIVSSFFLLIVPALLLFVAGGLFLVSRFLRSVTEVSKYAEQLLKQPLDQELPEVSLRTRKEMRGLIERLNPLVEKMRDSMRQVLSFTSLASHELRTPLAIVRNELENALQAKTSTKTLKGTVASTYNEILRMSRNVDDLLSLGTLQAGTFKLEKKKVGFHTLLKEFYDEALLLTREKNISVVMGQGPKVYVELDAGRIRQVLFNLLDNAIKHTPERGRIRLNYELRNSDIVLHFADSGPGISPAEISKIFDPFHRGDSQGRGSNGAGLGLSLVKWIVEAHGGFVTVESELGKGTKFIITLPVLSQN